jgi:hypothetical protein
VGALGIAEVVALLDSVGLGKTYSAAFREHEIDGEALLDLVTTQQSEPDGFQGFRMVGVVKFGHISKVRGAWHALAVDGMRVRGCHARSRV